MDAFSKDLFATFPEAVLCYGEPYIVYPDPIYAIRTQPGYIFDDTFWDVFHTYPFHICHVAWLAGEKVFEIRFRIDEAEVKEGMRDGDEEQQI